MTDIVHPMDAPLFKGLTSTNGMRRRLGRRWQSLHNAVYLIGILGVWHYWWQVKQDVA